MADDIRIGPVTPPKDVLDYFRGKSLRPAFSWLEVFGQEHAHAFSVAKATEADVLAAFRATIDDAIARGLGFEDWRSNLEPRLKSLGWWGPRTVKDAATGKVAKVDFSSPRRLRNIFWSNMRAARAAGQWDRAQATKDVLPYLLYNRTTATDPRPEHLDWVGILLPVDHPFWQTHFPPNGWGCKCSVRQVGRAEARKLGGPSADPVVSTTPFVNRRTGEQVDVPVGIDPGWHTNPGHARSRGLGRVLVDKIDRILDHGARQAVIEGIIGSPQFERMVTRPRRPPAPAAPPPAPASSPPAALPQPTVPPRLELPVIELPERPAGAATSIVLLSSDTAAKQARRHPEVTVETYQMLLPEIVMKGEKIAKRQFTHFVAEIGSRLWHAVFKAANDGALYLTTLHRVQPRDITRLRQQAEEEAKGVWEAATPPRAESD